MSDPGANPWVGEVRERLGRFRGAGVVVAVSGGGDSVGLLRMLHPMAPGLGIGLSVAHLDHGARGEESAGDARFVEGLAAELGLPFDLGHWRAGRAGHFEADARAARYAWLAGVARDRGASAVAVGQTLDDQAETILHRVVRGTGLRGLAGIPARRPLAPGIVLIRPLLGVTRLQIRDHLDAIGQGFREDSSNLDTARTRARIRFELLPELADQYNPAVAQALVRLGRLASGATRALERHAREQARAILLGAGSDRLAFDRSGLARLDPFLRAEVVRVAWRDAGWPERSMDARRWRRLAALIDSGRARISVGCGVEASVLADRLVLTRSPDWAEAVEVEAVELPVPGRVGWVGGAVVASWPDDGADEESVDLDRLVLPLMVRRARPGDRFDPLGLGGRTQPLNDFFRGRRVGRTERGSVPIVADAEGIVWVAGHRIAHRVRLTEATTRVLGLRFEGGSGDVDGSHFVT